MLDFTCAQLLTDDGHRVALYGAATKAYEDSGGLVFWVPMVLAGLCTALSAKDGGNFGQSISRSFLGLSEGSTTGGGTNLGVNQVTADQR